MNNIFHNPTSALPGPVTTPGMPLPNQTTSIPLQNLPQGPGNLSPLVDEQAKRDAAWKYEGHKALSKWMASDDDFFVFRRFESLNAGVITWMQDRISRIETRLSEIHKLIEDSIPEHNMTNASFQWDANYLPERHNLMRELSSLLHHYNQYIDAFSKIRERRRAGTRQVMNITNWLARDAIDPVEKASFVENPSDLISISSSSRTPFGQWLFDRSILHVSGLFRASRVKGLHVNSTATTYSSDEKFEKLTTIVIICIGGIMLLAPLWWLDYVVSSRTRLKIITAFVCVFITLMSLATNNKPFEVVAATAAYTAVLMVFMQIDENKH